MLSSECQSQCQCSPETELNWLGSWDKIWSAGICSMLVSCCSYICQTAACCRPASCYWSHISQGWPQYSLSAYLCISVHLLIFSSEVRSPPRPHPLLPLPGSTQGNAPLIMGTCPPSWSRHLTSKQTFVGCRVIGAPASRCKLDTSLVTTNIATRGEVEMLYNSQLTSLTRFVSQQAASSSQGHESTWFIGGVKMSEN